MRFGSGLVARVTIVTVLAVAAMAVAPDDAVAQRSRRAAPPPKPKEEPLPITYADELSRCATPYHAALQAQLAAIPQPIATVKASRQPLPQLTGRWVFHQTGDRRRDRDAQGRRIDGNKVCTEEIVRAGRSRCGRWEPYVPARLSTVPTPKPTKDETRLLSFITEFVANKGAPPEFLSNGRYTILTERVGADLEAYLGQPQHPALCAGAPELVEFFVDRLAIFTKRTADVYEMQRKARALAGERLAALEAAAASPPPAPAVTPATAAIAPEPPAPPPRIEAPAVPPAAPIEAVAAIRRIAAIVLPQAAADAVAAEASPPAALARISTALGSDIDCTAPDELRALARAALRTAEAAYYVDLLATRYVGLEAALQGNLKGIRQSHAAHCTCGG